MNSHRFPAAIVLVLLLCSSVAAQDSSNTYDASFECRSGPLGLRLPKSYEAVRSIGKLKRERVVGVQDWETYKTEDRELIFSGLTLHVVTFTNDKSRYLVSGAVITGSQWALAGEIKIGDSVEEVLRRIGKGTLKGGEIEVGGDVDIIRFRVSKGKVTKITYECYTG